MLVRAVTGGLAALALASTLSASSDEIRAILREVEPTSASSRRTASEKVVRLGAAVVPDVFLVFGQGTDSAGIEADVLFGALASLPREALDAAFAAAEQPEAEIDLRVGALIVLGRFGGGSDLGRAVRIARDEDLADDLRAAVASVLKEDRSAFSGLWSLFGETPDVLLPAVVRAIGDADDVRGLVTLGNLLNEDRVPHEIALGSIAVIADGENPPFDVRVLADVRRVLDRAQGAALAAAARAAGRLQDFEALPELIELLDSTDPKVKTEALGALRFTSGLDFRSDSRRWAAWYDGEREWWEDEAPAVIDRLGSSDIADVVASVNVVVARRLYRNELAVEVYGLLSHSESGMRSLACSALGQLGSTVVLEELVRSLDDSDSSVRSSAWSAARCRSGGTTSTPFASISPRTP